MDKAVKYYKKALVKYHKGYIDDAINLCTASMTENKRYNAAASLKGMLLYFKGDLENARDLWSFNVRLNKDGVSQKYIQNTRSDDNLLSVYSEAVLLINQVKINEGLELLRKCEVSDFNVINVSNYIALCLIKQGEFDKAKVYLKKVINLDKKNKMALDNIKMMKKYGVIKKKYNLNITITGLIILLVLGSGLTYYNIESKNSNEKKYSDKAKKSTTTINKNEPKIVTPSVSKTETNTPVKEESFPYDQVKKDISDSNYDNMYNDIIKWKDKNIQADAKALLDKANLILKSNANEYFYKKATEYSKEDNFKAALDYYNRVYFLGKSNFFEHGLFFSGSINEKLGNNSNAIKYYEEYNTTFPTGSYEETVLYSLVMLYKNIDIIKSKYYGGIMKDHFPNSIYYNSNVKDVLSK